MSVCQCLYVLYECRRIFISLALCNNKRVRSDGGKTIAAQFVNLRYMVGRIYTVSQKKKQDTILYFAFRRRNVAKY